MVLLGYFRITRVGKLSEVYFNTENDKFRHIHVHVVRKYIVVIHFNMLIRNYGAIQRRP